MKCYVFGRREGERFCRKLAGPFNDPVMASHEAVSKRLDGYVDVFVRKAASGGGRR